MDISYLVRRAVREHGSRSAVVCGQSRRTYRDLDDRAGRLSNALAGLGLQAGDRVAILLENRIEYVEVDVALGYGGFVRVALNARLGVRDFGYAIADSGARAIVSEANFDDVVAELVQAHDLRWIRLGHNWQKVNDYLAYEDVMLQAAPLDRLVRRDEEAIAWISYTSGTTGRPKGVCLSRRAIGEVGFNLQLELGPLSVGGSILVPQPLSHGAGYFVLPYLANGGTVHVATRFAADEAVALGAALGIDTLKLVPTMLVDLLELGCELPFRTLVYGAAPIGAAHLERALERFGPVLIQIYGQTEAPATITVLNKADHAEPGPHRASAGRPWRTVEAEVVDAEGQPVTAGTVGELVVRTPHMMSGYHNRPDLTAEVVRDGALWTRDMAVMDDRGYVYLRGRRDDMINSGGFNIAPKEVEEVLCLHPAVLECVALGVPDQRWGQSVCAVVVPLPGQLIEPEAVIEFGREQLGFRRPRRVLVVDALPYTPYGKVDRSELTRRFTTGAISA